MPRIPTLQTRGSVENDSHVCAVLCLWFVFSDDANFDHASTPDTIYSCIVCLRYRYDVPSCKHTGNNCFCVACIGYRHDAVLIRCTPCSLFLVLWELHLASLRSHHLLALHVIRCVPLSCVVHLQLWSILRCSFLFWQLTGVVNPEAKISLGCRALHLYRKDHGTRYPML